MDEVEPIWRFRCDADATLPYEFGDVCLKLGLLGEASKAFGQAVKLAPENADYTFGMGIVSSFARTP